MDAQQWRTVLLDLESQIEQNEKRLAASRAPRDKRTIKAKLPQLNSSLDSLDQQLTLFNKNPSQYGLNQSEVSSFISKINSSRAKLSSLDALCNKGDDNSRSPLLGDPKYRNIQDSEQTINMTNQQLFTEHQIQQANQEAQLDNISDGLTQLNDIANEQNRQLIHHNDMMQKLDQTMDATDENMRNNVKRVDIVEENSRGGWFSILAIILLLVLIFMNLFSCWFVIFYPGGKCPG